MDQYILKRTFFGELQTLEDHPAYPEEDDVIAGNQRTGREITFEIFRIFIRPAHRRERPKC